MPTTRPEKATFVKPFSAYLLIVLALMAVGFTWWQQSRMAPVRSHIEAGIKYLEQGQGPSAEREWQQAVQLDNHNAEAWEFLANYYKAAGNWSAAREAWNHVLELHPTTPQIHYNLALCNERLNEMDTAQHHAKEELKLDANHIGALDILTTVMVRNAEAKPRLKHLQHLVELQPENADYIGRLAESLAGDKQYEAALPLLNKLIKMKPDFGPAYSLRGAAILYTDSSPQGLKKALTDLELAVAQDPNDAVALLFIGKVYLKLKKPKEAIQYLERLEKLPTAHLSYLFELATAYQMLGNTQKAIELRQRYAVLEQQRVQIERLETRVSTNPKDFDALLKLGLLILNSRKPVGAEKYINQAAALQPKDARAKSALQQLERVYTGFLNASLKDMKQGNFDKVGANLGRAMMIRPNDERTTKAIQQLQVAASGATSKTLPKMQ